MVKLYFGLPGCGKTTLMAKLAKDNISKYCHVYGNVKMSIPGYTFIDNDCIGKYDLNHALILIDEATLFADSRDFKNFKFDTMEYFLKHRHFKVDIVLFVQQWDAIDRKIRTITDRVYWVYKPILFPWISKCIPIPYGVDFANPKTGQRYGDIIQGYGKPSFLDKLFAQRILRWKYYQYFDSFETYYLPPLPDSYKPFLEKKLKKKR